MSRLESGRSTEVGSVEAGRTPFASEKPQPVHVIPDGGLRAWATVVGAWFVLVCTFGYVNAFGVYESYYVQTLLPSYSASSISWIGSLQLFFLYGAGIFTGRLFDAGYFRPLVITGSVVLVGSVFALSAVQQDAYYQVFLSQGVGQGLAQGLLFLPSMAVLSQHFQKRRALAMGIAASGSSVGGIIFPIMLNNLFISKGFAWGVRATGFLMLGCLILVNLLMTEHRNPSHKTTARPKILKMLADPPYAAAVAGVSLVGWGIFLAFFYIQLFTLSHGISETLSFYTLAILNAASVFGRTVPNFFADKLGSLTLLIPSSIITGALIFAIFGVTNVPAVIIFCILYGFFSGAFVSLMSPMFAHMADDFSEIGMRIGVAMAIVGIAVLTGTPIDGALLGGGPDYAWWKAILFSGITTLAGCALLSVAWVLLGKKKNKRWV